MSESTRPAAEGSEPLPVLWSLIRSQSPGYYQALSHTRVRGKGHFSSISGDAQDGHIGIVVIQHVTEALPRQAIGNGQGKHQSQDAAGLQLLWASAAKAEAMPAFP